MFKYLIIILFTCTGLNYSQSFSKKCKEYSSKVSIGSDVSEVKKIMGKPSEVMPGFYQWTDCSVISTTPIPKGQLNYTTWIYRYPELTDKKNKTEYYINGREVNADIYEAYTNLDSVWIKKVTNVIIDPGTLEETRAWGAKLAHEKIVKRFSKFYTTTFVAEPIVCVVFEKGTSVVSSVSTYFIILHSFNTEE